MKAGRIILIMVCSVLLRADDFKPVSPKDLAARAYPEAPGAHAIVLDEETQTDDVNNVETKQVTVKILTEEGTNRANINIIYDRNFYKLAQVKGRTIRPDGTVVLFDGKVYDKIIEKNRTQKILAKTFTLPDVQPGSVIQYRYTLGWDIKYLRSIRWVPASDLFVRRATYNLKPYLRYPYRLNWIIQRLPEAPAPKSIAGGLYELVLENLPAVESENYSPPEDELRPRFDFFYTDSHLDKADKFWMKAASFWESAIEGYIGNNRKAVVAAANEAVQPADTAEQKLRKIYARAQQLRNTSYDRPRTEVEEEREKLKVPAHVEEGLALGHDTRDGITRLFVAMARSLGFLAHVVRVSHRDEGFFNPNVLFREQLASEIAWVKAEDKEYWLDPGTPRCPFGLVSWQRTAVTGLKIVRGSSQFLTTPFPKPEQTITRRNVTLKAAEEGFRGTVEYVMTGYDALRWRLEHLHSDEAAFRKAIEQHLKKDLPAGTQVRNIVVEAFGGVEEPLKFSGEAAVPDFTATTGQRIMAALALFQDGKQHPFQKLTRTHPVYFEHAFTQADEVVITFPDKYEIESVPDVQQADQGLGQYNISWFARGNQVTMRRRFTLVPLLVQPDEYHFVRGYFNQAWTGDQQVVTLRRKPTSAD